MGARRCMANSAISSGLTCGLLGLGSRPTLVSLHLILEVKWKQPILYSSDRQPGLGD
jgi:hypothetical protein